MTRMFRALLLSMVLMLSLSVGASAYHDGDKDNAVTLSVKSNREIAYLPKPVFARISACFTLGAVDEEDGDILLAPVGEVATIALTMPSGRVKYINKVIQPTNNDYVGRVCAAYRWPTDGTWKFAMYAVSNYDLASSKSTTIYVRGNPNW